MSEVIDFTKPRFDTREAAAYLGNCSPYTLRRSRVTGTLFGLPAPAFIKRGRMVIYEKKTLDYFLSLSDEINNTAQSAA